MKELENGKKNQIVEPEEEKETHRPGKKYRVPKTLKKKWSQGHHKEQQRKKERSIRDRQDQNTRRYIQTFLIKMHGARSM